MRPLDLCFPWMVRGRFRLFPPDRHRFPSTITACDSFLAVDSSQGFLDRSKKAQFAPTGYFATFGGICLYDSLEANGFEPRNSRSPGLARHPQLKRMRGSVQHTDERQSQGAQETDKGAPPGWLMSDSQGRRW